jgi:S-adenosylmethionine:tRNA ribosyltransferase-isomerase
MRVTPSIAPAANNPFPHRLQDYDYDLPMELVAQNPLPRRDASRLLVLNRATGAVEHAGFRELPGRLDDGDVLVVNNTRVFPARLKGAKATGGKVELLLQHLPPPGGNGASEPDALVRAICRGRLRVGQGLDFGPALHAEVLALPEPGVAEVRLIAPGGDVRQALREAGEVPLPPYIRRLAAPQDRADYQTVFAAASGAVACPTAGLHFTPDVLADLARQNIDIIPITLHVGPGTFMPVREDDYRRHRILPEYFELTPESAARLNAARRAGKRLVAVGTTSVRVLEYCATPAGFAPQSGWCDLFIWPGYRFQAVDRLLTNFHLPKSTLLLLVSAFAGRERVRAAYAAAIQEKYRFYSYGDCMLIM